MALLARVLLTAACVGTLSVCIAACGETTSTGSFKGERHSVAQGVASFQSDVTAGNQKKLCESDLAASLVTRLRGSGGCQTALKSQLREIDSLNMTIESITLKGATATAQVKSVYSGKDRSTTLTLAREGKRWKVSGVQ